MNPLHHKKPAPHHHEPSSPRPVVHVNVTHHTPHHQPPPPRPVVHVTLHTPHHQPSPPRPVVHITHHQPSPPPPVVHVSVTHHTPHHQPSPPPPVVHVTLHTPKFTDDKATVRLYCKAKRDYSLTIQDDKVVLATINPADRYQHWIKAATLSMGVKDEQGFASFALVNKATGQALKHSIGATYPVRLTEYDPYRLDQSVLWTQS